MGRWKCERFKLILRTSAAGSRSKPWKALVALPLDPLCYACFSYTSAGHLKASPLQRTSWPLSALPHADEGKEDTGCFYSKVPDTYQGIHSCCSMWYSSRCLNLRYKWVISKHCIFWKAGFQPFLLQQWPLSCLLQWPECVSEHISIF